MVSSSGSFETSTETRLVEQSDCVVVNEEQVDQSSAARKSSSTRVDNATIVQGSTPPLRSGYVESTIPRKPAAVNSSESEMTSENTHATTVYDLVGVAVDHTTVVGRSVMEHVTRVVC